MDGWMDGCFGSFVLGVEKMIGENASSVGRCPLFSVRASRVRGGRRGCEAGGEVPVGVGWGVGMGLSWSRTRKLGSVTSCKAARLHLPQMESEFTCLVDCMRK